MDISRNSVIKMDYDPVYDTLIVEYPDLDESILPLIRQSFVSLTEAVRGYDIKKLLLDASKTSVKISEAENKSLTLALATELSGTRLTKVARIPPKDSVRESVAQTNIKALNEKGLVPYQLQTFYNKEEAIAWLKK